MKLALISYSKMQYWNGIDKKSSKRGKNGRKQTKKGQILLCGGEGVKMRDNW